MVSLSFFCLAAEAFGFAIPDDITGFKRLDAVDRDFFEDIAISSQTLTLISLLFRKNHFCGDKSTIRRRNNVTPWY
jgi:hypothetical protein